MAVLDLRGGGGKAVKCVADSRAALAVVRYGIGLSKRLWRMWRAGGVG